MAAVNLAQATRRIPGPALLAAWLAATVAAPVWYYRITLPVEAWPPAIEVFHWTVGALLAVAAIAAARWTASGTSTGLFPAVGVGTTVAAAYLSLSLALYWWFIPLSDPVGPWAVLSLIVAVPGAAIGYVLGRYGFGRYRPAGRGWYAVGLVVAVVGAVITPATLSIGARHSTEDRGLDWMIYGEQEPDRNVGQPLTVSLAGPGRYAIYSVDGRRTPATSNCQVMGPDQSPRATSPLSIPVDYSLDGTAYRWVATFDARTAGLYSATCQDFRFGVSDLPRIPGAVGMLIHWPLAVIYLLGALPGLVTLLHAALSRMRNP